jgi:hypothetical protein
LAVILNKLRYRQNIFISINTVIDAFDLRELGNNQGVFPGV